MYTDTYLFGKEGAGNTLHVFLHEVAPRTFFGVLVVCGAYLMLFLPHARERFLDELSGILEEHGILERDDHFDIEDDTIPGGDDLEHGEHPDAPHVSTAPEAIDTTPNTDPAPVVEYSSAEEGYTPDHASSQNL